MMAGAAEKCGQTQKYPSKGNIHQKAKEHTH